MEDLRIVATQLRKNGLTYSEIAKTVPVSKATLSKWLSTIPLPDSYYEKLEILKHNARVKGWDARRNERIRRTERIFTEAKLEAKAFSDDPLWLVGLTLYWAEGSKEKLWGRGTPVTFTNMDVDTVCIFREWCRKFLGIVEEDFHYSLYVHDTRESESTAFAVRWARDLDIEASLISIYYKRSKISHSRKNDGASYRGVFRLQVKRSVDLNRKIAGWTSGMILSLRVSED